MITIRQQMQHSLLPSIHATTNATIEQVRITTSARDAKIITIFSSTNAKQHAMVRTSKTQKLGNVRCVIRTVLNEIV